MYLREEQDHEEPERLPSVIMAETGGGTSAAGDSTDKPSVLVLGGVGFIGRHFVQYVMENGLASRVRIADKVCVCGRARVCVYVCMSSPLASSVYAARYAHAYVCVCCLLYTSPSPRD